MGSNEKIKALVEMSREERAHRTYQRVVYRRLVDFQLAIRDAKRVKADIGVIGELDTEHMIEQLCKIADIEWRSQVEKQGYQEPVLGEEKDIDIAFEDEDVAL